jgi:hypothetical protein
VEQRLIAVELQLERLKAHQASEEGNLRRWQEDVDERIEGMEHAIYGNGGPGILTRLALGDAMLKELQALRAEVATLQRKIYIAIGAGVVIVWLLERFF